MSSPWLHRLRQVLNHLDPRPLPAYALAWVERQLSPAEQALFFGMRRSDQRHAVAVARAVGRQGELSLHERWIVTRAALLHDVGKQRGQAGLVVRIVNALFPRELPRWVPAALKDSVEILRSHPARGAGWLRKARTEAAVVALVRWHEAAGPDSGVPAALRPLLGLLRQADEER